MFAEADGGGTGMGNRARVQGLGFRRGGRGGVWFRFGWWRMCRTPCSTPYDHLQNHLFVEVFQLALGQRELRYLGQDRVPPPVHDVASERLDAVHRVQGRLRMKRKRSALCVRGGGGARRVGRERGLRG